MAKPGYRSYIGATGFTKAHEVSYCNYMFERLGLYKTDHVPMMGFLVSDRTLRGEPTDNKRYAPIKDVRSLAKSADGRIFRTVHYNTHDMSTLPEQIGDLLRYGEDFPEDGLEMYVDGIQLNMAWPDRKLVERIGDETDLEIILQVSAKAMAGMSPEQSAKKVVADYQDLIDTALYDPSGGTGKKVDLAAAARFYETLRLDGFGIGFGVAGGLSPENVAESASYFRRHCDGFLDFLSIDVESGIRKVSEDGKSDGMSMQRLQEYFTNATRAFYPSSGEKSD